MRFRNDKRHGSGSVGKEKRVSTSIIEKLIHPIFRLLASCMAQLGLEWDGVSYYKLTFEQDENICSV
jgi:hypothetical protein